MKQVKPSLFLTLMLCVLIGYFEPANAQATRALSLTAVSTATASMVAYTTTGSEPFWPNPVGQSATVTVTAVDVPVSGYLMSVIDGSQTAISIIGTGSQPTNALQTNQWFPVDAANNLYSNNASLASSASQSLAANTSQTLGAASASGSLNSLQSSTDTTTSDSSDADATSSANSLSTANGLPSSAINLNTTDSVPNDSIISALQTNQWFPVDQIGNPIVAALPNALQTNQWFPVDRSGNPIGSGLTNALQTNQWFPVDMINGVANLDPSVLSTPTVTTVSLPSVQDGNYVLVLTGQSGNTYSSNIVISSSIGQ